jgi:heme-degrading monooxygenase HmoA
MSRDYQLAQVNIARLIHPIDAPQTRAFVDNLERINALAEAQPGFVWRLVGDGDDATDIKAYDDPSVIINMSVWRDVAALAAFVYRSEHTQIMRRRREWFHEASIHLALWWIEADSTPSVADARDRLQRLEAKGPTPFAFNFVNPFGPPEPRRSGAPILEARAAT